MKLPSPLFLAIMLLLFLSTAFLAWQNWQLKQQLTNVASSPSPTPRLTPNLTANWKTYTNSQYGYSVKYYPPLNPTKEISDDIYLSLVAFDNPSMQTIQKGMFSISVGKTELDKEVEYQKWTVEGHILASLGKEENISFQGYRGVRLEYKPDEGLGNGGPFTIVIINNGKYSYAIRSIPERIDQILSTFRLLDDSDAKTVVGIQTTACCSCPTKIDRSRIGKDGWVVYKEGKDYRALRPATCSTVVCAPCEPVSEDVDTAYTCPANGWVDCMLIIEGPKVKACSPEALEWYKANCPNFRGVAY